MRFIRTLAASFVYLMPLASAMADHVVTYEYSVYGVSMSTNYGAPPSGTMSPYHSTNHPGVNAAYNEAVRYGNSQALNTQLQRLGTQLANMSDLERRNAQVIEHLYKQLSDYSKNNFVPGMPIGVPTQVPASLSVPEANAELDPLWKSVQAELKNPVGISNEIGKVEEKIARLRSEEFEGLPEARDLARYLESELGRVFVDSQGLLKNVPFSEAPSTVLLSDRRSAEGRHLRGGLNALIAARSVFEAHCHAGKGDCAGIRDIINELSFGHALADRLLARGKMEAYSALIAGLDEAVSYFSGFTTGVVEGAVDFVEGMSTLITDFPAVARGFYTALKEYPKTWEHLKAAAAGAFETLVYGSAEERGQIVGRLAFEVAALIVPVGSATEVSKAGKAASFTRGVKRAALEIAGGKAVTASADAGKISSEAAAGLKKLLPASPETAANVLRSGAAEAEDLGRAVPRLEAYVSELKVAKTTAESLTPERKLGVIATARTELAGVMSPAKADTLIKGLDETIEGVSFDGEVFRHGAWEIHPGNIREPHRFSRPGKGALYTSTDGTTVVAETNGFATAATIEKRFARVDRMLDLTNPAVREKLGLTLEQITSPSYEITYHIGDIARFRFNGIIAPSAKNPGGVNIVLFEVLK